MSIENDGSRKIVVLIDADNAQVGKLRAIMAEIATHGHIIVKKAYGDWSNQILKNWKDELNFLAIQPVQQFSYTNGKNSTDIVMVIDAMDLLYTEKYDAFVLVSSDSDFTSLASRLRADEIYVYGIGEKKTPVAFRNSCDDFIFTENLLVMDETINNNETIIQENNNTKNIQDLECQKKEMKNNVNENNIISLLNIAYETYSDDEGWTNVSSAGTYIKRSMPDFDSKNYGFAKLTELIANFPNLYEMKKYKGKGTVHIIAYRKKV
ncbi:MAG: NYN domain-containing protein [Treponema sp.]|jgi:uncharacterized LabA/DUF88 family protein|nr:NYN domain-containing protein [Treponema sp.]